jgi:DNA-binding PucR family transcriptional regulator
MSQLDAPCGENTLLGLLVGKASPAEYEELLLRTRLGGASPQEVRETEQAVEMAMRLDNRMRRLDQRRVELAELVDAVRDFGEQQNLDALLRTVARRARRLIHADAAYVALADRQGSVAVAAGDGAISALSTEVRLPPGHGMSGESVSCRAPVWTADYARDEMVARSRDLDEMVEAEGISALLALPLRNGEQVIGVLLVAERSVRSFTADEVAWTNSLADHAAGAIARTRALDETRNRLAFATALQDRLRAEFQAEREAAASGRRMIEAALAGGSAPDLATSAAKALAGAVALRDDQDVTVAHYGDLASFAEEDIAEAVLEARLENRQVTRDSGITAVPVRAGEEDLGALVLCGPRNLDEIDLRLLRHAVSAAAVLALSVRRDATGLRGRDQSLEDLLSSPARDDQPGARQWTRSLGLDPERPHVVVVARIENGARGRAAMWAAGHASRTAGVKLVRDEHVVLLMPGDDPGRATRKVALEMGRALGRPVQAGGAAVAEGGRLGEAVPRAYQEALRCLEALTAIGGDGAAATVEDLGFVGMLLGENRDVSGFIDATLGPVLAYDTERSTDLEGTLAAYYAVGGSPTHAAEALQVHPNTVARRLERVAQLLGPDWQRSSSALQIQLALQLQRVRHSLDDPEPYPQAEAS